MPEAILHDGSRIQIELYGEGPTILLPVNPHPIQGAQADELRKWGVEPALGRLLIDGLSDHYRVVAFDYEGHLQASPKPDTLTPDHVAADLLAVADAAQAEQFAYYGYSWLALVGMQLAIRTKRVSALMMGGFPPIDGPYKEMLSVTTATYKMSLTNSAAAAQDNASASSSPEETDWSTVQVTMSEGQTKQYMTLYQQLNHFNDRSAQAQLTCPRLCFAGSQDRIEYGERWGDVLVDIAGPLIHSRNELVTYGWEVHVLDGLDHTQAMQPANVIPLIRPWLDATLNR